MRKSEGKEGRGRKRELSRKLVCPRTLEAK